MPLAESYKVKLRQFCNKYKNPTEQLLWETRDNFRDDKQYATVKECYEAFLERTNPEDLKDPKSSPSYTSWSYVGYCKEEFDEFI